MYASFRLPMVDRVFARQSAAAPAARPAKILAPYVCEGMTVLEPGPGMGFFTLELARRVGASGRVVAVDIQPRMLDRLKRPAGHVKPALFENELAAAAEAGLHVSDRPVIRRSLAAVLTK